MNFGPNTTVMAIVLVLTRTGRALSTLCHYAAYYPKSSKILQRRAEEGNSREAGQVSHSGSACGIGERVRKRGGEELKNIWFKTYK
jgi:hypothetical protein